MLISLYRLCGVLCVLPAVLDRLAQGSQGTDILHGGGLWSTANLCFSARNSTSANCRLCWGTPEGGRCVGEMYPDRRK